MALVTTSLKEGKRESEYIILCDRDDPRFYQRLIEEEIYDVLEEPTMLLPTFERLLEKGYPLPREYTIELDFASLANLISQSQEKRCPENGIYMIPLDSASYLFTKRSVRRFASAALYKAQTIFQNSNLLAAAAALLGTSLVETKKNIGAKQLPFWLGLTEKSLSHRKQLENHRKLSIPPEFFSLMAYLHQLFVEQEKLIETQQKAEQERKLDLQTIAETIKSVPGMVMTKEQFGVGFQKFKEKYGEDYESFREEFEEKFMTGQGKTGLSMVLSFESGIVHSENIYTLFVSKVNGVSEVLQKIYISLMTVYVRRGGQMGDPVFSTPEAFAADIGEKIKIEDPILYDLLQKPQAVAEAIISSSRKSNKLKSVEDMRLLLASFFYPDQIKFKDLSIICGIDLRDIYKHAFMRLSILRQIIMRITGKHESFNRQFAEQVQRTYGNVEKSLSDARAETSMIPEPGKKSSRVRDRQSQVRGDGRIVKKQLKPLADSAPVKPKEYSQAERESAWSQFSKSVKK